MISFHIEEILGQVQKPGRYLDIELNRCKIDNSRQLSVALCFPDLYDIGMSNNALRIIYSSLNSSLKNTFCERVFMPFPDMEKLLHEKNIPLFTLENQTPVRNFTILAFSIAYELLATNVLTILSSSQIPLLNSDRSDNDPIIIAGGPSVSNPLPYSDFIDCFFIGDFEKDGLAMFKEIETLKASGADRTTILDTLNGLNYIWHSGKKKAYRTVWNGFPDDREHLVYPLPIIDVVQDQGVVEIMRGCPNGCRFCHAGSYYKPVREKKVENIVDQVDYLVNSYGYKEITLASLSSGDYSKIAALMNMLGKKYSSRNISFNLPSLKVTGFTLNILEKLCTVRKSGLTFAIETPDAANQRAINKEVFIDQVIDILKEARNRGWKSAKFYFMIGLPVPNKKNEAGEIIQFLQKICSAVPMQYNLNIGTFVPKPHTPYERVPQLGEMEALDIIYEIKKCLPKKHFKVGFHSPFASLIEGVIARGNRDTGKLLLDAFKNGARLDAWEEHLDRDLWSNLLSRNDKHVSQLSGFGDSEILPWNVIDTGVQKGFLLHEKRQSDSSLITPACDDNCIHNCGVCKDDTAIFRNTSNPENTFLNDNPDESSKDNIQADTQFDKLVFRFNKTKNTRYISNINLYNMFQRVFQIAKIPVKHTQGFNPKPKIEIVQPLSLGIESLYELCKVEIEEGFSSSDFISAMNKVLPDGIQVIDTHIYKEKSPSLSSLYYASEYHITTIQPDYILLLDSLRTIGADDNTIPYFFDILPDTLGIRIPITSKYSSIIKLIKDQSNIEHPLSVFRIQRYSILSQDKSGREGDLFSFVCENFL